MHAEAVFRMLPLLSCLYLAVVKAADGAPPDVFGQLAFHCWAREEGMHSEQQEEEEEEQPH